MRNWCRISQTGRFKNYAVKLRDLVCPHLLKETIKCFNEIAPDGTADAAAAGTALNGGSGCIEATAAATV